MRRQVGIRKTSVERIAVDASLLNRDGIETGCYFWPGMSLAGDPFTGQVVSGVEAT